MERELVMAVVGITLAVVGLGVLSVIQQSRLKREKEDKVHALRSRPGGDDAAPGTAPFFVARFRGGSARFFRIYTDEGTLLFLHAGPFLIMVDPDTPRGTDRRHWLVQAASLLAAGLGAGVAGALAAFVVIGRALARNANHNPDAARSIVVGVLAIVALLASGFIIVGPLVVWRITRRAALLGALPLSGLRELAETDDWSFRAGPEDVSDVKVATLDVATKRGQPQVGGLLTFRHAKTGKWKIETTTTRDTADAVDAFRRVFGTQAVIVEDTLAKRLAAIGDRANGATGSAAVDSRRR